MDVVATTRVFRISEGALERFGSEFAKIQRRAFKLGVTLPSYSVDRDNPIVETTVKQHPSGAPSLSRTTVKVSFNVTVVGHAPVLPGGWKLVATLDHIDSGNVIKKVAHFDGDVPAQFRTVAPWCDHCNVARRRGDTFVLVDESGSWKQVGRQCLADFLGSRDTDPAALAWSFDVGRAFELAHAASMDSDGSWGSSVESRFSLVEYLTYAVAIIRIHGWLSRREAEERGFSRCGTADSVLVNMRPRGARQEADAIRPTDEDEAKARAAIAWVAGFDPDKSSDFDFSMRAIATDPNGTVEPKNFGIAAYIPVAHSRALAREAAAKAVSGVSAHFGEVGKRATYEFTVVDLREMNSMYGLKTLVSFRDANGNVAKWFCTGSAPEDFKLGAAVTVKATVKRHGEFRGVKETSLSRVSPVVPTVSVRVRVRPAKTRSRAEIRAKVDDESSRYFADSTVLVSAVGPVE